MNKDYQYFKKEERYIINKMRDKSVNINQIVKSYTSFPHNTN